MNVSISGTYNRFTTLQQKIIYICGSIILYLKKIGGQVDSVCVFLSVFVNPLFPIYMTFFFPLHRFRLDCEFVQPGNYLSTINKEIEKFDELWALSRSVCTSDTNQEDDDDNNIHYQNVDFQQDNLYSAPMNNNNFFSYDTTIKSPKLVNCFSCKCKKQSSNYQQCSTTFCYQLFTLNWRSYLSMKRYVPPYAITILSFFSEIIL